MTKKKVTVYFEENPKDLVGSEYIASQEAWQKEQLTKFVDELESDGRIRHPDARWLGDGRWSLWIRKEGQDAVNHICYVSDQPAHAGISPLANLILNPNSVAPGQTMNRPSSQLVVARASSRPGEEEDNYSDPETYAVGMDEISSREFMKVIGDIRNGTPSPHYTLLASGEYNVHIDLPSLGYGVHIHCTVRRI
jgi:hypothetical protein